jgi:hypothetical protein
MRASLCQIVTYIGLTASQEEMVEQLLQQEKGKPHNHVDVLLLVSIEATGVCIPIGNSEVLLATAYV